MISKEQYSRKRYIRAQWRCFNWKYNLENMTDLCVEFSVEEVVLRIWFAEWMTGEQSFSSRAIEWITNWLLSVQMSIHAKVGVTAGSTYIVKQSYMKASAAGLMFMDTSSGIGGAWLRLPSLNMAPMASSLLHGRRPANISNTTHPSDQISTLAL